MFSMRWWSSWPISFEWLLLDIMQAGLLDDVMKFPTLLLASIVPCVALAQKTTLEETDKVFSDAPTTEKWIYNDLAKGFADAETTGKPLMVVYRCIP